MSSEVPKAGDTHIAVATMREQLKTAVRALEKLAEDISRRDESSRQSELDHARFEERTGQQIAEIGREIEKLGQRHLEHGKRLASLESRANTAPIEIVPQDGNTPQAPQLSEEQRELLRAQASEVKARTKIWVGITAAAAGGGGVVALLQWLAGG